jgi:hypothetical protein
MSTLRAKSPVIALIDQYLCQGWSDEKIAARLVALGFTVSGGKGDDTLKKQEQAQADFTNTLQANYKTQFAQQSQILSFLQKKLEPQINNPQGYDAKTLATMRTGARDTNASEFAGSERSLNTALTARTGATTLPSGVDAQLQAMNFNDAAANESRGQNDITMADANLKNANYWNSVNALSGNAAQFNPTSYSNSANSSASTTADLGSAYQASKQSQLMSTLGGVAAGVGGAAIKTFCPVKGTLYLMADGSEKLVENLIVGDELMGIDGEPQTIEEIQTGMSHAIQVSTANGYRVRNSPTHAFVLPHGGFTVAARSMGKMILTDNGPSRVVSIEPIGAALVFNVITDGSHSYRADGVWALGVGEAERHVSMPEWREIGEQLVTEERMLV